jgi:hypothetical protein
MIARRATAEAGQTPIPPVDYYFLTNSKRPTSYAQMLE